MVDRVTIPLEREIGIAITTLYKKDPVPLDIQTFLKEIDSIQPSQWFGKGTILYDCYVFRHCSKKKIPCSSGSYRKQKDLNR